MANSTFNCDGHLFVLSDISAITKCLLTPPTEHGRDVFFDVITRGQSGIRVNMHAPTEDEVAAKIVALDAIRDDLVDAVIGYNDQMVD